MYVATGTYIISLNTWSGLVVLLYVIDVYAMDWLACMNSGCV